MEEAWLDTRERLNKEQYPAQILAPSLCLAQATSQADSRRSLRPRARSSRQRIARDQLAWIADVLLESPHTEQLCALDGRKLVQGVIELRSLESSCFT